VYCRAFVIMAMILQVLLRAVNFLTSWTTVSVSRRS
jgi:hypothetical protein